MTSLEIDKLNGFKICKTCKRKKSLNDFYFRVSHNYFRPDCKICTCEKTSKYQKDNREKVARNRRERYNENESFRLCCLEQSRKNRETERYRVNRRRYEKARIATDINFKLAKTLRRRTAEFIKTIKSKGNIKKCAPTLKLLGCTLEFFKNYLENKFTNGMTWQNHGYGVDKWHLDHILPCSSFDLTKPEEQNKCFHYTNLQPLWQTDNFRKGDSIILNE